jgi:hypothetical protein
MFTLRPTTSDEVIKLISSISDKKATGLDQIPCKLLKLSAPIVSKSLCDIFNLSIQTAIFPDASVLSLISFTPISIKTICYTRMNQSLGSAILL